MRLTAMVGQAVALENDGDYEDDDHEMEAPSQQGKGPRERVERTPLHHTVWWKMWIDPRMRHPGSLHSRRFRRRFRVSPKRFELIVDDAKTWHDAAGKLVFPTPTLTDTRARPLEIKVMVALRFLATGATFDTLGELSGTSDTVARVYSHGVSTVFGFLQRNARSIFAATVNILECRPCAK